MKIEQKSSPILYIIVRFTQNTIERWPKPQELWSAEQSKADERVLFSKSLKMEQK